MPAGQYFIYIGILIVKHGIHDLKTKSKNDKVAEKQKSKHHKQ